MSTQDKLARTMTNDFREKTWSARESWRVFGIMAEFVEATERFRTRWRKFLYPIYPRRFMAADVERIPRFSFEERADLQYSTETAFVLLAVYGISMVSAQRFVHRHGKST